jgi:hypothetical protein
MSIRIVSVAAMCLAFGTALAQGPAHDRQAANLDRLAVLLDLNEGQKVEVAKVLAEQREEAMSLRKKAKASGERPSREQMHAQREQLRSGTIDKLRPILTDQQLQKFEALGQMEPGRGPGHGRRKAR